MKKSKFLTILTIVLLFVSLFTITVKADDEDDYTQYPMLFFYEENVYNYVKSLDSLDIKKDIGYHNDAYFLYATQESINAITSIDLTGMRISSYDFLKQFPNLMELVLVNNGLTTVPDFSELENLKGLDLSNNNLTDISNLAPLTNLTRVDLRNNKISDISSLSNLTKLLGLHIDNNNISDLSAIKNMIALIDFSASNNNISDLSPLSNFDILRSLDLSSNLISDISPIKDLGVRTLDLSNNNISDISNVTFTKYETADFSNNKIIDGWNSLEVGRPVSAKQQKGNIETSDITTTLPDIFSRANLDHATITTDNGTFSSDYTTITFDGTKDDVIANVIITGGIGAFDKSVITIHYKKAANTDANKDNNTNKTTTANSNNTASTTEENKTQESNSTPKVTLENVDTNNTEKVVDTSTAKGRMPYTGITRSITIAGIIVALAVLVAHTYYQNKKSKE